MHATHPAIPKYLLHASAVLASVMLLVPVGAAADSLDWSAVSDEDRVEVITQDEDGDVRETTIWIAVHEGEGYIRTGSSRWGRNVKRDPHLVLRVHGVEYPFRAEFIEAEDTRTAITATFREKYGWSDVLVTPIRGSNPNIMKLHSL